MKNIIKKAPGKIILIGEHAVVYGYPAILSPINLFSEVTISDITPGKVRIDSPNYNFDETLVSEKFLEDYMRYSDVMKKYKETNDEELLETIRKDKNAFPKIVINNVFKHVGYTEKPSFFLHKFSNVPQGGFGSSSSVGASIIKAIDEYYGFKLSKQEMIDILMKGESEFHGYQQSGGDQNVVFHETLVHYQKKDGVGFSRPLKLQSNLLDEVLVINTGKPKDGTGEVVNKVRESRIRNQEFIDGIFERLGELTEEILGYLENDDKQSFYSAIDEAGDLLIDLGIVRPKTQELIKELRKLGGYVKVSGAGAITGDVSGALLCFGDDLGKIESYVERFGLESYRMRLQL